MDNDHQILILDDKPYINFILKKFLEKKYTVLSATTIDEANDYLADKNNEISIAFIDFNLEDEVDGIEYAKHLKNFYPLTQVIMITGESAYGVALKALNSGVVNSFISKPFALPEIQKTLDQNLQMWGQNMEIVGTEVERLFQYGEVDSKSLENGSISAKKFQKIIAIKATENLEKQVQLLGFGITRGDKILLKHFFDKNMKDKYTPLFAKFIQTVSNLNFDLFVEADNYKLEELTMEDVSILFQSIDKLSYSVFLKGDLKDKSHLAEEINKIAKEISSQFMANSTGDISTAVKDRVIDHFKDFRDSFTYT